MQKEFMLQKGSKQQNHKSSEITSQKEGEKPATEESEKQRSSCKLWTFQWSENEAKDVQALHSLLAQYKIKKDGNLLNCAKWIIIDPSTRQVYLSLLQQRSARWLKQFIYVSNETVTEWNDAPSYDWSKCLKELPKGCELCHLDPKTVQAEHKKKEDKKKKDLEKREQVPDKDLLGRWSHGILKGESLRKICQKVADKQDLNESRVLAQNIKALRALAEVWYCPEPVNGKRSAVSDLSRDLYDDEDNDNESKRKATQNIQIQTKSSNHFWKSLKDFGEYQMNPEWRSRLKELKSSFSKKKEREVIDKAITLGYDPIHILDQLEKGALSERLLKNLQRGKGSEILKLLKEFQERKEDVEEMEEEARRSGSEYDEEEEEARRSGSEYDEEEEEARGSGEHIELEDGQEDEVEVKKRILK